MKFSKKSKKKIYLFIPRFEHAVSGEAINTRIFIKTLSKYFQIKILANKKKNKSYFSFKILIYFFYTLSSKLKSNDTVLIKLPTTSQIILFELLLKNHKFKRIYLIDGLNYYIPNLNFFSKMFITEPILTISRLLLNNSFYNYLLFLFKINIIVPSDYQKKITKKFLSKESKISIIQNFNYEVKKNDYLNKNSNFGFFGHNYPVKGFDLLTKSSAFLERNKIYHTIICRKPIRGKNFKVKTNSIIFKRLSSKKFFNQINTVIFPFQSDFGTNIYPSAVVESILNNKNLIIPDFEIFRELIRKTNYSKKVLFFKKNNYLDLSNKMKLIIQKKIKFTNIEKVSYFDTKNISKKWIAILK